MKNLFRKENEIGIIGILGSFFAMCSLVSILVSGYYEWVLILINTFITLCFIFHDNLHRGLILTYGILFNVIWWLYTNIYLINIVLNLTDRKTYDFYLVGLSILSMISFNFIYYFGATKKVRNKMKRTEKIKHYNFNRLKYFLILMCLNHN